MSLEENRKTRSRSDESRSVDHNPESRWHETRRPCAARRPLRKPAAMAAGSIAKSGSTRQCAAEAVASTARTSARSASPSKAERAKSRVQFDAVCARDEEEETV